jgi:large subunit ribosomal protein L13
LSWFIGLVLRRIKLRSTFIAKPAEVERKWFVVDADGQTLGRLCTEIAKVLRGKNKPIFTPHVDTGDYVIVINAEKIKVTGKKLDQKMYRHHSGYPGGLKETPLRVVMHKAPENVIYHAVKGMLPKNNLGRKIFTKLHVYSGPEHKHQAQQPEALKFED